MQQSVQKREENLPALTPTSASSLKSLARRMGDPKAFRNTDSLRSQLQNLGDHIAVRDAVSGLAAGPERASPKDFAKELGRLAVHYWRPDFSPDQARMLYGDFIRLLEGCTAAELREASDEWIMDPLNSFYPTPGKLHELMRGRLAERARIAAGAEYLLDLLTEGEPVPHGGARDMTKALRDIAEKMRVRN